MARRLLGADNAATVLQSGESEEEPSTTQVQGGCIPEGGVHIWGSAHLGGSTHRRVKKVRLF